MFSPDSDQVAAFADAFEQGDWSKADALFAELTETLFNYRLSAHDDYEIYYDFLIGNAEIDFEHFSLRDQQGCFDQQSGRQPDGSERLIYEDHLLNCTSTSSTLCFRSYDVLANLARFAFDGYYARRYGFNVNHVNAYGRSLLEEAIDSGYTGRIRILRSLGARVASQVSPASLEPMPDRNVKVPVASFLAAEAEAELQVYQQSLKLIEALLNADFKTADRILATTPEVLLKVSLARYIQLEAFHQIQPGSDALSYLLNRRTPLHGPGIDQIGLFGRTPLDTAIESGHREAVVWLRALGARCFREHWLAARGRGAELKSAFTRIPHELGQTMSESRNRQLRLARSDDFLMACRMGRADAVHAALESGVDVIDAAEAFALAFAHQQLEIAALLVRAGLHPSLLRPHLLALLRGQPLPEPDAWLDVMLESGVAVNFFDLSGDPFVPEPVMTPLDHAWAAGHQNWLRVLRQAGALRFEDMLKLLD